MSALYERAQKTVVMITSAPVTAAEMDTATWLNLSCTIKQASLPVAQLPRLLSLCLFSEILRFTLPERHPLAAVQLSRRM